MLDLTNALLFAIVAELALLLWFTWAFRPKTRDDEEHQDFPLSNYAVWKFEENKWTVIQDRSLPGFHPGDPPSRPGNYPHEVIKKP